ncbi:MAG: hypothetical protein MI755_16300 [Sphingomonadales bacterium]|nr:hypothetical protein [Sphingomonadales bacterium]
MDGVLKSLLGISWLFLSASVASSEPESKWRFRCEEAPVIGEVCFTRYSVRSSSITVVVSSDGSGGHIVTAGSESSGVDYVKFKFPGPDPFETGAKCELGVCLIEYVRADLIVENIRSKPSFEVQFFGMPDWESEIFLIDTTGAAKLIELVR